MLRALVLGAIFCSGVFVVQASEVLSSADVLEAGSWAVSVYGQGSETKPQVKMSGIDAVSVPVSGGMSAVSSNENAEIKMEQTVSQVLAAFEFRPSEGLKYRFKVGQVREFDLEFSSGSQTNKLQASNSGYVWGVGLGGRIAPGSIVSTAISWDLGYTQTDVSADRFEGGPVVYAVNEQWRQEEYQGSLDFSRRWKAWEPFAGIKLTHVVNRLMDGSTKRTIGGTNDGISPFIGLQWMVADKESLVVEGSFLDEKSLTAGFKVQF